MGERSPGPGITDQYGLSPVQEGMFFHHLSGNQAGADIELMVITLPERVHSGALRQAWQEAIAHHPVLRSGFALSDAHQAVQNVYASASLEFTEKDWSALPAGERQPKLDALLLEDRLRGFDLETPPLLRVKLIRFAPGDWRLLWTFHHIVLDGRSFNLVLLDVFSAYEALQRGERPSLPPRPPFRNYIESAAAFDSVAASRFWSEKLKGVTAPTPLPIEPHQDGELNPAARYGEAHATLSKDLTAALESLAVRENLTLNTLMMGVWAILMSRYSGESDIVFGATKTARRGVEGGTEMVGLLLNTIPVRIRVAPAEPALAMLKRLREEWLSLRPYENTPLVHIHRASEIPGSAPLFDTLLVFEAYSFGAELRRLGGAWERRGFELREQNTTAFTLLGYGGPELLLKLEYDGGQYRQRTAQRVLAHVVQLFESIAAAPEEACGRIPYLTASERQQILIDWNDAHAGYPREATLPALLEAQTARTPDNAAVIAADGQLTYAELNRRANRLAAYLRARGVGPGALVGISMERSLHMLAALLAVLKAGGAYVPLDPSFPAERLRYIAQDAELRLVLTEEILREERESIARESEENIPHSADADALAYVLYTSGSTGNPKGVEIPHRALANFLLSMRASPGFAANDVLLAVTTISFDIAGLELYLPLISGGTVVLATREQATNGEALIEMLRRYAVTVMQATPATWQLLIESDWEGGEKLKALCGGEALPRELARELLKRCGELWNMYGPTETTIWSLTQRIDPQSERILIGRPIANTTVYILDANREPVAAGVTGELYIGGEGLARGYHRRPDLTADRFVQHPFESAGRLYRTGDLARYWAGGSVECLGRLDFQVKVRGFRIELGEIETVLGRHPAVQQNVVAARPDRGGGNKLVAYVIPRESVDAAALRAHLKTALPDYMLPSDFVFVESFPLTPNGKVDRKALPDTESNPAARAGKIGPRTPVEQTLAGIWSDVLGVADIGVEDDFFELGGHSLLSVRLFSKVRKAFPDTKLSLAALLRFPTIAKMSQLLSQAGSHGYELIVPIRPGGGRPRFFCVHGAGGNILSLRPLALALPGDLPFYAIQSRGLDGSEPFHSVEEAAGEYVEEVRKVQPHGPYYLGGTCYGGAVAFEMARILESRGEPVAIVALVDTLNFGYPQLASKSRVLYLNARYMAKRTMHHLRSLARLGPSEWGAFFSARIGALSKHARRFAAATRNQTGENLIPIVGADPRYTEDSPQLRAALDRVIEANTLSINAFKPKPYPGEIVLFRATRQPSGPYCDEPCLGWDAAARKVIVERIPGDHASISEGEDVRLTAAKLDQYLRAAERSSAAPLEDTLDYAPFLRGTPQT